MAYPSHYYGDPAAYTKFEQEKSCDNCAYQNKKWKKCMVGGKTYPKRCEEYKERSEDGRSRKL